MSQLTRKLGLLAALVARPSHHFLVFFLPHSLAALLDERTHDRRRYRSPRKNRARRKLYGAAYRANGTVRPSPNAMARSSTGRTSDFGSGCCRFESCRASQHPRPGPPATSTLPIRGPNYRLEPNATGQQEETTHRSRAGYTVAGHRHLQGVGRAARHPQHLRVRQRRGPCQVLRVDPRC